MRKQLTHTAILLSLLCVFLPTGEARASSWLGMLSKLIIQGGFEGNGYREDGSLQWEISGRQLRKDGLELRLEGYRLVVYGQDQKETMTLESPRGLLYPAVREIRGDAPIIVNGKGISVSGIGYDLYLEQRVFQIRSNVMLKMTRENVKKSKLSIGKKSE